MGRFLRIAGITLAVLALLGFAMWRWLTAREAVPERSDYAIDLEALRGLAGSLPGPGPRAIETVLVAEVDMPRGRVFAGEPFDPSRPLSEPPNRVLVETDPQSGLRDLDFDALELMNGPSLARYRALRADWFALLRQGEIRTGTANSDSHQAWEIAALPRNYVRLADDRVAAFEAAGFVRAVLEGRLFGTTGPLLDVRLGEVGLGDRHVGREALLRVAVQAADWVPLRELRVFVNGEPVAARELAGPGLHEIPLAFERDAFLTVEVEGPALGAYAELYPGFTPFAFTNPIFVDADADGAWTAPGLR